MTDAPTSKYHQYNLKKVFVSVEVIHLIGINFVEWKTGRHMKMAG